jgi:hypothetical protein
MPMSEMQSLPVTNGKGAAAIMAVGVGSFALGVFTLSGDAVPAAANFFNIWKPTGPLSGVTALTIAVWLLTWFFLSRSWAARDVNLKRVNWGTAAMIIAGLLLTFPPVMDFLQGK